MLKTSCTWVVVVAFLNLIASPGCGAETSTESSTVTAPATIGAESSLPEHNGSNDDNSKPSFSMRESLQLAAAIGSNDAIKEESSRAHSEEPERTTEHAKKAGGLSTGAIIGIVIIGVALVALAAVAAGSHRGSGGISGVKLNFGK